MTSPQASTPSNRTTTVNSLHEGIVNTSVQAGHITGGVTIHEARFDPPPPFQGPQVPPAWVDRDAELRSLYQLLDPPQRTAGIQIISLHGPHGIGKSALAARILKELVGRYPGGQLYVDMRGSEPEGSRTAANALGQLLRAMWPGPLPAAEDELVGWWRSVTAGRPPLCVLLDNVADAAVVRRLLPGGTGHLVVATSQSRFAELAADGADLHELGPLPPDAARAYLTRCVGDERLRAEPEPTSRLLSLAAGVPQALRLTVGQLAQHPHRPVSSIVRALLDSQRNVAARRPSLRLPGAIVTTHLDTTYADLPRGAARSYRHLALLPLDDIDVSLTSALSGFGEEEAASALGALAAAHLLEQAAQHEVRGAVYRWPSAEIRQYGRERALAEATDGEAQEILRRALRWALAATATADALITPSHSKSLPGARPQHDAPAIFTDRASAMAWLKAAADSVLALIRAGHAAGEWDLTWRVSWSLWPWWRSDRRYSEWIEIHRLALEAVRRCQDPAAEMRILSTLGVGLRGAGELDEAIGCFQQAREMADREKDQYMVGQALHELGATLVTAQRFQDAVPFLEQASEVRLSIGYTRGVALTNILLGQVASHNDDHEQACRLFSNARDALLDMDDPHDAARALAWRGRVTALVGDISAAETTLRTAHNEFVVVEAPSWAARTIEWLGEIAEGDDRVEEASALYAESLTRYERLNPLDAERLRQRLRALA
ncbi:tetratricopeptide repeat protein [Streptomyces sp. NPDC059003]|uniref:tetratricopeptide repeat protein n=1 Tax=Streptomyces sp. NPDC059003 TaxID=3346691 RepID=UPI003698F861